MADSSDTEALLLAIGKLQGSMDGMRIQIAESNSSMNRRIDDLSVSIRQQAESMNRRIDDHQDDVNTRFESQEKRITHIQNELELVHKSQKTTSRGTVVGSGAVTTVIVAGAEIIKAIVSHT